MPSRIFRIDELSIKDHHYLTKNDECWYFGEYTASQGFLYSDMNQLIFNFKKNMSRKSSNEWVYKENAIKEVGRMIASIIDPQSNMANTIFVPIPPSKIRTDSNYDDRLVRALNIAKEISNKDLHIHDCISQLQSTTPDHKSRGSRICPDTRAKGYYLDLKQIPNNILNVIIVDDVITTGSHFKGVEIALRKHLPNLKIRGLFIARAKRLVHTAFEAQENSDLLMK